MIDKCVHHEALVRELKMFAQQLGFDLVGITAVGEPATYRHYEAWLDAGFAAEMVYMVRTRDVRRNPQLLFMNAKSMIIVGMSYAGVDALLHQRTAVGEESEALCGRVARYACMRDYHDVLRNGLQRLLRWLRTEVPDINGRICVDSAPILERDFATRAGLGWVGKNTNVINRKLGSYFVIGELIVDVELPSDIASNQTYCGKCMQCIEACPTGALVAPFTLDARKCISYLTIEHKGIIPHELRPLLGRWVFGCDVCQEVCPWNRKTAINCINEALSPQPKLLYPNLLEWIQLTDEQFRETFRNTPIIRAKRRGLLRNVAVALGNIADERALPALISALFRDPEPLVRGHVAWALGQFNTSDARRALKKAHSNETIPYVREEIEIALNQPFTMGKRDAPIRIM